MPDGRITIPRPTRLLLLRHAETAAPGQFHGAESDVDLGPRGVEQAQAAALMVAKVEPVAIYSSAMLRARRTAAILGEAIGLEPVIVPALHERRMGSLSGQPMADGWDAYIAAMNAWKARELTASHAGGESFASIRDRVLPALARLVERHQAQTIVVVAHGVVIRVALACWLDGGPERFDRFGIDFVTPNDLTWDGQTWRAAALNGQPVGD